MRRALPLLVLWLAGCAAGGGRAEVLSQGPSRALTRLAVAGVTGPAPLGGEALSRALAAALSAGPFEAVAAADADTVLSSAQLGLAGAGPGLLAELRRATDAEAAVFGSLAPRGEALELTVLDARSGDLLLRVRTRPRGEAFRSVEEAAAAGAAALSPLAKGRRGKPSAPPPDELPPP